MTNIRWELLTPVQQRPRSTISSSSSLRLATGSDRSLSDNILGKRPLVPLRSKTSKKRKSYVPDIPLETRAIEPSSRQKKRRTLQVPGASTSLSPSDLHQLDLPVTSAKTAFCYSTLDAADAKVWEITGHLLQANVLCGDRLWPEPTEREQLIASCWEEAYKYRMVQLEVSYEIVPRNLTPLRNPRADMVFAVGYI